MMASQDHALTTTAGKGTLTLAALTAALLLGGCGDRKPVSGQGPHEIVYQSTTLVVGRRCDRYGRAIYVATGGSLAVIDKAQECTRGSAEGVAAPVASESSREAIK